MNFFLENSLKGSQLSVADGTPIITISSVSTAVFQMNLCWFVLEMVVKAACPVCM